jgi:hypothetical protein
VLAFLGQRKGTIDTMDIWVLGCQYMFFLKKILEKKSQPKSGGLAPAALGCKNSP